MKPSRHPELTPDRFYLRPLAFSLMCVGLGPMCAWSQGLPSGLVSITKQANGTDAVTQATVGTRMTINQAASPNNRAIAQWSTFNIDTGNAVNIVQPNTQSVLLNRVLPGNASTIAGNLTANGQVFLINPSGVLFSKNSTVSVGGLVASTLDVGDANFLAGGPLAFSRTDTVTAKVVNLGSITATAGPVVLMGAGVSNGVDLNNPGSPDVPGASINVASGNTIGLVSANRVTVDFNGDGLTTFTIPADSRATSALVANAGVLTANGGQVSLLAASQAQAQVVNTTGVIQARSLTTRGGQIVLDASGDDGRGSVAVGGTMDVSSINAGQTGPLVPVINGGSIVTQGGNVNVVAGAVVKAGGSGNGGGNGSWAVQSSQDLTVANDDIALAGSIVNATALGNALGNSTNVVLNSDAVFNGQPVGAGVNFASDALVNKTAGPGSTLAVNSTRGISMAPGSAIGSNSGALNVDFNADAKGGKLPANLPILPSQGEISGGAISIVDSKIETNGGSIRFYGQSDPVDGRAVGSSFLSSLPPDGITIAGGSMLSACAVDHAICTLAGDISLRGEGRSTDAGGATVLSGVGVGIDSSTVRAGSGAITVDGLGALGASGVRVANASTVSSASGNIALTGVTRGWNSGSDPVVLFTSKDTVDAGVQQGGGSGVSVRGSAISTGGNVALDGTGGNLLPLINDTSFQQATRLVMVSNSALVGASNGVTLNEGTLKAGLGQGISISGTGGSNGYQMFAQPSGAILAPFNSNAYGVRLDATPTTTAGAPPERFIEAEGGSITIDGRGSLVNLSFDGSGSASTGASLLSVSSSTLPGGTVHVTADNLLVNSVIAAPQMIEASGTTGGKIELVPGGQLVLSAGLSANGATGKGGEILTQGQELFVDDTTDISATSGPTDVNGRWTAKSSLDLTINNSPSGGSQVSPGVVSRALSRSTDVVIDSDAAAASKESAGFGVTFGAGVQVVKSAGRDVTLTVNSGRNISMNSNSSLRASTGALNVTLNADASTRVLPAVSPIGNGAITTSSGGAIMINTARIQTNGGSILFYGQSDPLNGRAVGSISANGPIYNGITVNNSLLSACAGSAPCTSAGDITLRGRGSSAFNSNSSLLSGIGVDLVDSGLRTGSGAITINGQGGLGSTGIDMTRGFVVTNARGGVVEQSPSIASTSGDVLLTGTTRGWSVGEPTVISTNDCTQCGHLDGVSSQTAAIQTGGNVTINGVGTDVTPLFTNTGYLAALRATGVTSATVRASQGVELMDTAITAGAGKDIAVSGTAGSGAATVTLGPDGTSTTTVNPQRLGVRISNSNNALLGVTGGHINIDGRGTDVSIGYVNTLIGEGNAPPPSLTLLNVSSTVGAAGGIDIEGRDITMVVNGLPAGPLGDASGANGGTISVRATADPAQAASGAININQTAVMLANANTAAGNGGNIHIVADGGLREYGAAEARGGVFGGNGGLIETSGRTIDILGFRADASAPAGKAGTWLVDPFDLTIAHGQASGILTTEPFNAVSTASIQDGDINKAFTTGTNVTLTTGSGGDPTAGSIQFGRLVDIDASSSAIPVTFRLDAAHNISTPFGAAIVQSSKQPLSVVFNAGTYSDATTAHTGSIDFNGQILTNGGDVTMNAPGGPNAQSGIALAGIVDTRAGRVDTGTGGNITLTVPAGGLPATGFTTGAIDLDFVQLSSSTGNVVISGNAQTGTGVLVRGSQGPDASGDIWTTTGAISLTGIGGFSSNSANVPGDGVTIQGATLRTQGGSIAIHGLRQAGGASSGAGVNMVRGATIATTGGGDIDISGESAGNGAGLFMSALNPPVPANEDPGAPASSISGAGNVVLRASNDGTTDAIVLHGTVQAANVLNLRPGGVDASTGAAMDRSANPITLMGGGAAGYAISADELTRLSAATIVIGSNTHAGNIDVTAPMTSSVALTLENGGGGNITLNAPISTPTLGLVSGGNITQAADAGITAGSLLATSSGGNVMLADASNNVSTNTLAGNAVAGSFAFVNSGALKVGPVSVTGYDAAGNVPNVVSVTSMAADTVLVRTLSGDLSLASVVSSKNGTDLVAAATFQNVGGSVAGAPTDGPFRIWANTWIGEARGTLAGSGDFPNFYHCAYLGLCTVNVTPGDNHFIYAQQPTAIVTLNNITRLFGQTNPTLTYSITGLILGDRGGGVAGLPATEANVNSAPGSYPISGTFSSREGYAVNVVPGRLLVVGVPPPPPPNPVLRLYTLPRVDYYREQPDTWVYDRNIGLAPICVATGPLDTSRGAQDGDVLAREWSRVRTRPNLTSCVDTERHNGCAGF